MVIITLHFQFSIRNGFRHSAVGQQHKLLDELVGIFRLLEEAARGVPFLVDIEVQFFAVEVHGSVLEATLAQLLRHAVQHDEFLGQLARVGFLLRGGRCRLTGTVDNAVLLEYLLHLLVGEAAIGTDDGMGQVPRLDVGVLVHDEDDAVAQLVLVGPERTDIVAEPLREHGDGAVDQIDARGALLCLAVDDAPLGDVVRHVGNVDTDLVEPPSCPPLGG